MEFNPREILAKWNFLQKDCHNKNNFINFLVHFLQAKKLINSQKRFLQFDGIKIQINLEKEIQVGALV